MGAGTRRVVACCLAAMALGLVGVVTLASGGTGTISQILSGESSIRSAWVSISESGTGVTFAGPYDFESMAGRLVATGRYRGTLLVSGTVTLASAGLIWGTLQPSSGTPGLPIPRPNKPWVREPPGAPTKGGAIGDILLGSQLQAAPAALVDQLQRQVSSISSLGSVVVDGSAEHEYRLVVRLDGLSKVVAQPTGSLEMLGKAHTFFIWVDGDHRIVKLSTSIAFESPARTATISLTYSRFNIHVTLAVPSDASIESLQQYHEQIRRAWGCPPNGGMCKNVSRRSIKTK